MKISLFSTLLLCATLCSGVAAEDYEIRLHRPAKVGQRTHVVCTGKDLSDLVIASGDTKLKSERKEQEVEYEAEVTVREVGAKGRATKESHKVTSLVKITNGERRSLLAKGTVVTATKQNKKPAFEIAGTPMTKELQDALALVIDISDDAGPTEDEIFGTKERKKIGGKWSIDKAALEKELSKDEALQLSSSSGEFTLKEAIKTPGGEALVLEGQIKGKATFPLPPGFKIQKQDISMTLTGRFPVDASQLRLQESSEMGLKFLATGKPNPEGPEVQFNINAKRTVTRKLTPLK